MNYVGVVVSVVVIAALTLSCADTIVSLPKTEQRFRIAVLALMAYVIAMQAIIQYLVYCLRSIL